MKKTTTSPVAMDKRRKMNYKVILIAWIIFSVSIIYWDIQRWEDEEPVSACHGAEIKVYHDRNMCTECKLFCEVKGEER